MARYLGSYVIKDGEHEYYYRESFESDGENPLADLKAYALDECSSMFDKLPEDLSPASFDIYGDRYLCDFVVITELTNEEALVAQKLGV